LLLFGIFIPTPTPKAPKPPHNILCTAILSSSRKVGGSCSRRALYMRGHRCRQGLLRPAVAPALPTSGGATLERQGRGTRSFRSGASSQSGLRELRLPTHRNRDGLRVDEIDGRKALGAVVQLCLGGQHRQESCDRIRARHRRPSVCLAGLADLGCLPL
jgi:hypothetical protein